MDILLARCFAIYFFKSSSGNILILFEPYTGFQNLFSTVFININCSMVDKISAITNIISEIDSIQT